MARRQSSGGCFITFEGPEGAGKSTQIRHLGEWFRGEGRECVLTREPGGTGIGEDLRRILKHHQGMQPIADPAEVLLFAACRAQHVHEVIRPAMARGAVVLCDRFIDSTVAYQGYARGLDLEFIHRLNDFAVGGCRPDLTLLLDISPEESAERTLRRGEALLVEDRIEAETREFHRRVRDGFLRIAQDEPERVKRVDAAPPMAEVHEHILELVRHALGRL
jgi:dTMP kinase